MKGRSAAFIHIISVPGGKMVECKEARTSGWKVMHGIIRSVDSGNTFLFIHSPLILAYLIIHN